MDRFFEDGMDRQTYLTWLEYQKIFENRRLLLEERIEAMKKSEEARIRKEKESALKAQKGDQ